MRRRGEAWRVAILFAGLALLLSACGADKPQNSLDPAGRYSRKIDALFDPVFWIAVAVFVLVEGLMVVILVKFRHRPGNPVPKQIHGNKRLEIGWTLAPSLLLAGVAVFTLPVIFQLAEVPTGNVMRINVTGHQWWWEVKYPAQKLTTANEVHIPVGQKVYVTLTSNDVIHSFWVPRLAGKQDLEPNRKTHLLIEADAPGSYLGQCAEFCGLSHANMHLRVVAETRADFDAWVQAEGRPAQPPPEDVFALMTRPDIACNGCHTIDGVRDSKGTAFIGTVGPNLTHFASRERFAGDTFPREDRELLAQWLLDAPSLKPGADMPSFVGKLSKQDIDALIAYLESLE
ncbi:MAG TPA: cytochrome c oxidase subunit II [Actinomycetota bacterium]|nr:cytochrome c oxidase subunit II [Actinomycetota bacterium]